MISVVVPCYNCEKTIRKCVDSIIGQTDTRFEIILVDDGSTDNTGKICDEYKSECDAISVVHQCNGGLMAAWKRGVEAAKGDYITFADSDDWIEDSLIGRLYEIIDKFNPDIITFGIEVNFTNGKSTRREYPLEEKKYERNEIETKLLPYFFSRGTMESPIILPNRFSKAIKRSLLLDNMSLLNNRFSIGEDDLTSFVMVLHADSMYNIKNYYPYHYCRHSNSMMGNYGIGTVKAVADVKKELQYIASKNGYKYSNQMEMYFLDNLLITVKKIAGEKKGRFFKVRAELQDIWNLPEVRDLFGNKDVNISQYTLVQRIFYWMFCKRFLGLLIIITRICAPYMNKGV